MWGVALSQYDTGGRPAEETVGQRPPVRRQYDAWSRESAIELPAGIGRDPSSAISGCARTFDALDRLVELNAYSATTPSTNPNPTVGGRWDWGGVSRIYGVTTNGPQKIAHRYSYLGSGAGPQPGGPVTNPWRLGVLTVGSAATPTEAVQAPANPWGSFGFGYRQGHGAKLGREVGVGTTVPTTAGNLFAGQGWAWQVDNGLRLSAATPGKGLMEGLGTVGALPRGTFAYRYGEGDELYSITREGENTQQRFVTGAEGRIETLNSAAFRYDPEGNRKEDDRFVYQWNWRGEVMSVTVKDQWIGESGQPYPAPNAGQQTRWERDALGRPYAREVRGAPTTPGDEATRPFISRSEFLWDGYTLLAEVGKAFDNAILWRKSYVPGAAGLDDALQVRVEKYGVAGTGVVSDRTYTYIRDEQGTVQSLVEEQAGADPTKPLATIRYFYTAYGAAHAEVGPEIRSGAYESSTTTVTTPAGTMPTQTIDPVTAVPGAYRVRLSSGAASTALAAGGVAVEQRLTDSTWGALQASAFAMGLEANGTEIVILPLAGWTRGATYRIRLTSAFRDLLDRAPSNQPDIVMPVPTSTALVHEVSFPVVYESYLAASETANGAFPGGQPMLYAGAWTDSVTGLTFLRARWYDTRTASFASRDVLEDRDSSNLYGYVAGRPQSATDPTGLAEELGPCPVPLPGPGEKPTTRVACTRSRGNPMTGSLNSPRARGALKLFAGTIEACAGATCLLAPEPTGGTKVLGFVTLAHASDVSSAGLRQIITGREEATLTQLVVTKGAEELGADPRMAQKIGLYSDEAASMALTSFSARAGLGLNAQPARRGLGNAETSPWLADSRVGVVDQIERFRDGATFLIPESKYKAFVESKPMVGDPAGQFVFPRSEVDRLLATGNRETIKKALGIPESSWNEPLRRIDIQNPLLYNARFPTGLERGANSQFHWGGYTSGGVPELVIDPVPASAATVSKMRI